MSKSGGEQERAGLDKKRAREIERRLGELTLPLTSWDPNAPVSPAVAEEIKTLIGELDPAGMGQGSALALGFRGNGFGLPDVALQAIEEGMSAGGWRRRELFLRRLEAWEEKWQRAVTAGPGPFAAPAASKPRLGPRPCPRLMLALREQRAQREAEALSAEAEAGKRGPGQGGSMRL